VVPIVSAIIPTFDRWPMVKEAVESVLRQSCRDFELIVVDDGSADGTASKLTGSGFDLRLISQTRKGVSAARNLGVQSARGKYVAFLDSDDLWQPRKLEIQLAYMEQHPEIAICQTEEVWLRNGVRVNAKVKHRKPSGDIFARSLELCLVSPSAVMIRKDFFETMGGFDEDLPLCEDYDLWLRIAVQHPVPLIPSPLVIKRGGHADQLSRSRWGMDRYRVVALQKLLRAGLDGEKRLAVIKVLQQKLAVLSQGARKRGKETQAVAYAALLSEFVQENENVGSGDSQFCDRKRLPSSDPGAVA
jgi:glycosyltransferase involved in cell wall biosynthesis